MSDVNAQQFIEDDEKWAPGYRTRRVNKLTPMVRARLVEGILEGLPRSQAATYAGISPSAFARWMQRGERSRSGPEHDLVRIIAVAEAQLEKLLVASIRKAAYAGDWRAAEALLKRRFPDRWGDRQRIDHHVIVEEARKLAEEFPELTEEEILAETYAVLGVRQ